MLTISTNPLSDFEIDRLIDQMKKSPHVGLMGKNMWKRLKNVYTAKINNELIGVCVVVKLKNWVKIGPIIILDKFQGKGYGKKLLSEVTANFSNKDIYIGSSNQIVCNIVKKLGFRQVDGFFNLPREIKIYLVRYFFERLNLDFLLDAFRKGLLVNRRNYSYFLRLGN